MKKGLTMIALCILYTSISIAQNTSTDTDNREKLQVGAKIGLNYSNVYDARGERFNADAKFGLATGVFMEIPFEKYLGLQPEIVFSQKGFKGSGINLGSSYQFTRTTSYIDIPLQLTLKPSEFITFLVGPQFSYLVYQQDRFVSSAVSYEQEQEFKNDDIRKNVFGIVGGLNINIRHVVIGARIAGDLQNNNGDGTSTTPRYKNIWYQATIGFKLYK